MRPSNARCVPRLCLRLRVVDSRATPSASHAESHPVCDVGRARGDRRAERGGQEQHGALGLDGEAFGRRYLLAGSDDGLDWAWGFDLLPDDSDPPVVIYMQDEYPGPEAYTPERQLIQPVSGCWPLEHSAPSLNAWISEHINKTIVQTLLAWSSEQTRSN